jgi:hypothetical protein
VACLGGSGFVMWTLPVCVDVVNVAWSSGHGLAHGCDLIVWTWLSRNDVAFSSGCGRTDVALRVDETWSSERGLVTWRWPVCVDVAWSRGGGLVART